MTLEAAFRLAERHSRPEIDKEMELSYVWGLDEELAKKKKVMLPKYAIQKVQQAMNGTLESKDELRRVLGETPTRWKYVYFTEPDLVIHTRSASLPYFRKPLDGGRTLSAFRFQLMPHESNFPQHFDLGRLLPNKGHFAEFVDLNPEAGDACCDNGPHWPGLTEHEKCCEC